MGDDIKSGVRTGIDMVNKAREGDDAAAIRTAAESLSISMQKIGEAIAKQGGQGTGEGTKTETPDEPKA